MKLEDFIPVIECSLKCADKRVVCVELAPTDTNELRIYMDNYFICVDITNCSLLEILGSPAFSIVETDEKD